MLGIKGSIRRYKFWRHPALRRSAEQQGVGERVAPSPSSFRSSLGPCVFPLVLDFVPISSLLLFWFWSANQSLAFDLPALLVLFLARLRTTWTLILPIMLVFRRWKSLTSTMFISLLQARWVQWNRALSPDTPTFWPNIIRSTMNM